MPDLARDLTLAERLDIRETRLPNGLTLLVLPDHGAPVFTIMLWVPAGVRTEQPGSFGLSHFLEHSYSMGSANTSQREIDAIVSRNGGSKNAFTSYDYTAYFENMPVATLDRMLEVEADRFSTLALPEDKFFSELEVVKEERRQRTENSPFGRLIEAYYEAAYTTHPYRAPIIGTWDDLNGYTRDQLRAYYEAHYTTENAVYLLVGDLDPDDAATRFAAHFGHISRRPKPTVAVMAEPEQTAERRGIVRRANSEQAAVLMGFHTVAIDHDDFAPLTALASVLSSGRSARLDRELERNRQLVTFASAWQEERTDPGQFMLMAQARTADISADTVEAALTEQIERIQQHGVTETELSRILRRTENQFVFGLEGTGAKAQAVGRYRTISRDGEGHLLGWLDRLRAVTPAEVQRVARHYLVAARRTVFHQLPG